MFSNLWTDKYLSFDFATAETWQLPAPVEENITTFFNNFHRVLRKSQIYGWWRQSNLHGIRNWSLRNNMFKGNKVLSGCPVFHNVMFFPCLTVPHAQKNKRDSNDFYPVCSPRKTPVTLRFPHTCQQCSV